jgi:hypothetical protein
VELQAILEGLLEKITTGYQRTETELDQPQGIESDQQTD